MDIAWIRPAGWVSASSHERDQVAELIGKEASGEFQVVVRGDDGRIIVIENAPFFRDGTPMPTRYWLVDPDLCRDVSKIESVGGVRMAEAHFESEVIAEIHQRYSQERDNLISPEYTGPRPSGGVGGTRKGLKCLHTHVAHFLVTKNDVVGQWTLQQINNRE